MRRLCIMIVVPLLATTCSSSPTVIPTKNLERPVDMTFLCLGLVTRPSDGTTVLSGQPMEVCHARSMPDPAVTSSDGQRILGTFAFLANSSRGEIAVADMDKSRLLDLATASPGYGMLPVGGSPEALATSQDGCWIATANRTSCDFSLIDPSRLLASTFSTDLSQAIPATDGGDVARRVVVRAGSGKALHTTVGEIAFLPPSSSESVCKRGSTPRAVATFPGCDMVALLDFSFENSVATIASAYYVRPDLPGGFADAGTEPVCPTDCTAYPSEAVEPSDETVDGGSSFDGGQGGAGLDGGSGGSKVAFHLSPLALRPEGTRVYVGSLRDTAVTSLDITSSGLANPIRLDLAEEPIGVSRIRLSVDPFLLTPVENVDQTTGGVRGRFLGTRGEFLYAFTRDDSIRVVDIGGTLPVECDVNILASADHQAQACFPVGTTPRRALAKGPGIRIPTFTNPDSPPPLPRDLAFADLQQVDGNTNYHALSGQFGFLLASNGQVYVLNLDPKGVDGVTSEATATHSVRESRDVGEASRTAIAVSIAPQRAVVFTDQAFATTVNYSALEGPLIQSFSTDGGNTKQWFDYPDPDNIISRSWDLVWEGLLPETSRNSGRVYPDPNDQMAKLLIDAGADFCSSGVQPGDVLMFAGCTQNSDCQPDDEFSCQVTVSGAQGMCLPKDTSATAAVINSCIRFMGSRMRYEVTQAKSTELRVSLKLDEVPKTGLNSCTVATQDVDCRPDIDHGKGGGSNGAFECLEVHPQDFRCVQRCDPTNKDSDCRAGHVCETVPGVLPSIGSLCVEAPPLDTACFPQPMTTYSVRAGKSFLVSGSSMPRLRNTKTSADGVCKTDDSGDPSLVARIPLSAPKCPDSFLHPEGSEAVFVQKLSAIHGSNPCLYTGGQTDGSTPGGNTAGKLENAHIRAFFQNPQIRFVITNLEQYAGDLLAIHFEFQYGFIPLTVQIPSYEIQLTMGTRILVGPTKTPESPIRDTPRTSDISFPYLYVVDEGRTALTAGSRGQVLRINPRSGSNEIASFDTALSGSTPFQLQ
jgi:hypothetical protein